MSPIRTLRAPVVVAALWLTVTPGRAPALQVQPASEDSVSIVPGAHYRAGPLYRAFMGTGHRNLWTTAIRVPVADLSTLGGGLTPNRVGGGMTTRTLHLDGMDGRRYVFRSVDKEPIDLINEFVGTPIEAILRDQMSSFHPSGAVVVAKLLEAVGVLHPSPRLVVVPDDPRLGVFREEFAGMLALFEERPDDPPEGAAGFAGSREVVQTDRLFEILEDDPRNQVEARELLKSRLIDLLVGDRDRSTNNHLWAAFDDGRGGSVWRPVPRDRDQAFVHLDGFLKGLARHYERRLVFFDDEYPSVWGLTRNAWDIDRNFLVGLSRSDWLATVGEVTRLLTDSVIDGAVRALPAAHYDMVGTELTSALRARRDHLGDAAEELYSIVFRYADIHATDVAESATVERREDGSVRVVLTPVGADQATTLDRTYVPEETREVRLYLHGGPDQATVTGVGPGAIRVRVIGGAGPDRLVDTSSTGAGANLFYDGGDATQVTEGPGTRFYNRSAPRPFSWFEESRALDWGRTWVPEPRAGYDSDRGLVLTAGVTVNRHGFLKDPYSSQARLRAGWSFGLSEPLLDYRHYFRDMLGPGDLRIHAGLSGLEIIDFYGLGNETAEIGPEGHHRVANKQVTLSTSVSIGNGQRRQLSVGPVLEYTTTDTTAQSGFIGATRPYGSGRFGQLGVQTTFELDGRDRAGTPSAGYRFEGGGAYFPELIDVSRGAFGEVHGQVAAYLSPPGGNPTLAVRARGKKVWGTYPFTDAAFLGGSGSLRGLREQRYAGDAAVLGSAEIRLHVARILFVVPSDFGVFGLTDAGRVFREGESSSTWYTSFGGGIWLAPLRRTSTVQLSLAHGSTGHTALYFGIGFPF